MEKIIVTGGAGFIGSHLTDKLINLGFDVTVVDDLSTGNLNNIPKVAKFEDLYIKLYDLSAVMLRYFNVYGTKRQTEKGSYPNVLAAFSKQKREKGKVYVTGDGEQSRDMIHVF